MKAEIVSVGTELIMGETVDTNANFLAGQLPALGIELYWVSQVADDRARLVEMLRCAWDRSDLVITTGGLGPTHYDLTRQAIADMLGEMLRTDAALEGEIRAFFKQAGMDMPASNLKQAGLIASAQPLHNLRGTAPGWWVEKDGHILVAMPGPPVEMQQMWQKDVVPRLQARSGGAVILTRTFKTYGLSEAAVGEMVFPLFPLDNPLLGIYAKPDGIHLRLAARAPTRAEAERMITVGEVRMKDAIGRYIWGTDAETLEAAVGRLLIEKGLTLAVMEDYSGGWLTASLTDLPGSETFLRGGLTASSVAAKTSFGVSTDVISRHGMVSAETARAMASAARAFLHADIGLGITGIEENAAKPAGLVFIGIDDGKSGRAVGRIRGKRRATGTALFELRRLLLGLD